MQSNCHYCTVRACAAPAGLPSACYDPGAPSTPVCSDILEPSPDILPGSCSFRQQVRVKTKTSALVSEVVRLFKLRDDDEES